MAPNTNKARGWVFTINNPTGVERDGLRSYARDVQVKYMVCGNEVGGVEATPHIQGFVYFVNRRTMAGIKRVPHFARAHLEKCRGTPVEAATYCKKDGDFWEEGELPQRGKRTDLEAIRDEIKEGTSELNIAENHFSQWVVYRYGYFF